MTKEASVKTEKKVIDLNDLNTVEASDKGARIELVHPSTKEGIGVYFIVLGKHSEVFREIVRDRGNKRVKQQALAARRNKSIDPPTAEQIEQEAIELLTACTVGWDSGEDDPTITIKGEKLPFNHANALRVYTQQIWIREQIDRAIGDFENFIKA